MKKLLHHLKATFWVFFAILLAFIVWETCKYQFVPRRWGVVTEGKIYRSGRIAPHLMRAALQKHGIKVIVDLTDSDLENSSVRSEQKAAEELGITRHHFELCGDGTGSITNYALAIAAIARAAGESKPVLVHCAAGVQRTGGVIAAYRLMVEKQLPATAYAELTRYGWKARSDRALLDYLNANMAALAALLREMGVIGNARGAPPPLNAP